MKQLRVFLLILFMAVLVYMVACVESYSPNISKYDDIFVVDGELTNLPGPYTVKLSRSYELYKKEGLPVTGAQVKIIESTGLEVELVEIKDGFYSTEGNPFQGQVGHSYKLQIKLNGDVYESNFETIKTPVPIDRVYWEYQVLENGQDGIQLMVDTHDSTNSTRYYAWYHDETWKFRVPIDVAGKPEWKICYQDAHSTDFNIATSAQRHNDVIERQPIRFFNEETNRLYIRYTALVRQYVLNEVSYKFFKDLITINQNQGTLFDPIPSSLIGNIKNTSNEDIPVLGYFLVTGASEKRIFIDREELPKAYSPTDGFDNCGTQIVYVPIEPTNPKQEPLIEKYRTSTAIVDSLTRLGYTEFERFRVMFGQGADTISLHQLNLARPVCFNCTLIGDPQVPEFWTEYPNK